MLFYVATWPCFVFKAVPVDICPSMAPWGSYTLPREVGFTPEPDPHAEFEDPTPTVVRKCSNNFPMKAMSTCLILKQIIPQRRFNPNLINDFGKRLGCSTRFSHTFIRQMLPPAPHYGTTLPTTPLTCIQTYMQTSISKHSPKATLLCEKEHRRKALATCGQTAYSLRGMEPSTTLPQRRQKTLPH